MSKVFLASPLHDPDGKLIPLVNESAGKLIRLYGKNAVISASNKTKKELIDKLSALGFKVVIQTEATGFDLGSNYRYAMKSALSGGADYVHLVDFDRALHWARRFPNELRDVISYFPSYVGYISFARTRRAFETHPLIQRAPEITINAIASEVAKCQVDIMSGAFGFDKNLAGKIVEQSKRTDYGIYAEFLTLSLKNKAEINVMEVEGLEWETPDQFKDRIEKEGYTAWLSEFESLSEWEKRIRLIEDSADVLI
jgi:hypothetical protein